MIYDNTQQLNGGIYKIDYNSGNTTKLFDFKFDAAQYKLIRLQDYLILSSAEFSYVYNLSEDKLEEKIPPFSADNIACKENKIFYIHQAHTTNRLGTFYFEDEDNGIYYYDLATKNPKKISDIIGEQLYIFDEKYIFCVDKNTLYQINIETGESKTIYKG